MFRSIVSLFILANLSAGAMISNTVVKQPFDPADLLDVNQIPVKIHGAVQPEIDAESGLVMDLDTGIVLYEKNAYKPMPMASLTKIMTAVIILESHELDEIVTVEENYSSMTEDQLGVRIWLQKGEQLTVYDLLTSLLVRSAGDSAMALAKYHSGSVDAFVVQMNKRAQELNLTNTYFKNPVGIDAEGHYSSSYDLAILTKRALRFSVFRSIIRMKEATISSVNGRTTHAFKSTNLLLNSYLDILGVKTGTTEGAGASVINLARNEGGHQVLAVLLNSPSRFQENKSMIDWTFRSYQW